MEKQKENPKFSFLFGGDFYGYYKYKLALEQQQREWGLRLGQGRLGAPSLAGRGVSGSAGGDTFVSSGLVLLRRDRFAASSCARGCR